MVYYLEPFTFDFDTSIIDVDSGTSDVDCTDLYTAVKLAQASEEGILYERIGNGTGLVSLGGSVQVGLTVELLGSWQLRFADGNYIARVAGGNFVGGPDGDPIAYSPGVQTLVIQSASSTVVTNGGGATAADIASAVRSELTTELGRLLDVWRRLGLDPVNPLVNTETSISAGSTMQIDVTETAISVTTSRQP